MVWLMMRSMEASRMALDRQIEQMEIRAILLRELNHRVKNTLATVTSLAALAREGATDVSSYYTALNGRLRARSDERRVGEECGSTCRYRWSQAHKKQKRMRNT